MDVARASVAFVWAFCFGCLGFLDLAHLKNAFRYTIKRRARVIGVRDLELFRGTCEHVRRPLVPNTILNFDVTATLCLKIIVRSRSAFAISEFFVRTMQLPLLLCEMPLEIAAQSHAWCVFAASVEDPTVGPLICSSRSSGSRRAKSLGLQCATLV